jgi:hypothetical protein
VQRIKQDSPHPVADRCAAGLAGGQDVVALLLEMIRQKAQLGRFPAAFWPFKGDEKTQGEIPSIQQR